MQKLFIFTICMATTGAYGATKCVLFNNCVFGQSTYNQTDWSTTCGTVSVRGVAACGDTTGNKLNAHADTVSINQDVSKNIHCWCRMIIPAVSKWSFANTYSNAGTCAHECVDQCAYMGASIHISGIIK